MTDQNTEVVQETQVETPSAPASSDEQATTPETPTQVDSAAPPVETAQKTAEQIEADRAHYQTAYQETQKELRAMRAKEKQPETATPTQQPSQQFSQQGQMTQEEMNDQLRDNPLLAMQALAQDNRLSMQNEFANMKQELQRDVALQNASDEANRVVKEFCTRLNIDPKFVNEATAKIKQMGIKGDPAQMAELTLEMAQMNDSRANSATANMQTAAETSASIKQQAMTVQPDTGAPSSPKSISFQDGISGKFTKPQNKNTLSRLFDGMEGN